MNDLIRQLGGALGVAVIGSVINTVYLIVTEMIAGAIFGHHAILGIPGTEEWVQRLVDHVWAAIAVRRDRGWDGLAMPGGSVWHSRRERAPIIRANDAERPSRDGTVAVTDRTD